MYEALTRASVVIELIEDVDKYEAVVVSTNGTMLQPYDTSTTLIGTVLKNNVDITKKIKNVKWTKWNPSSDNIAECPDWNEKHIGMSIIEIGKEDVDSKSVFTFEAYNDQDELLCSSSISIIDVNDLLVSTIEPSNPYVGQLWIDDSKEPATLYVWNGYKWIVSGTVGAIAKNLLKNTNFLTNADHWNIIGDTTLSYTPTASEYLGHRFLRLCSEVLTDEERGISQTTTDIINKNSEYSFQMLFYSKTDTETFSNSVTVNIYSVNSKDQATIIYDNTFEAEAKIKQLYAKFKTLSDTEKIRVDIIGECGYRYNFYVAELALYNTWNEYPWTINPSDLNSFTGFTQEELWNILSNNGTVQGIFTQTNPSTGQLDYYINASMIAAGKVKAQFMEMYGLKVRRKDTGEVTLYITENGEVDLNVSKLVISSGQTIEEAIENAKTEITPEGIKSTVIKIIKEDEEVIGQITSIAEQTAEGFVQEVKDELTGSMSEFSQGLQNITARVEDVETGQESLIDLTSKGVYIGSGNAFVDIEGNKITVSADDVHIDASNIALEGYTTINGGFGVDLEGNMFAKNGTFEGTVTASEIEMSTMRSSTIIAPNIFSDESENPVFSLTDDGTLTARNAVIQGELAGTILTGNTFMSANRKFVVTENGTLECVDANIKGDITAGSTVTGSKVVGGTIIGATIQNAETNPTFTVSSSGVVTGATIHGGTIGIGGTEYDAFTVDNNGNCNITRGSISIGNNFVVNNDGSFVAKSANITGNITSGSTITGAVISGGSINIGNGNFTVDSNGHLIAKSAEISAEMSADIGYIAGFKISDNTLTTNNVGISSATSLDSVTFWAGSNTIHDAPFRVNNSGKVFASNVEITGGVLNIGNDNFVVDSSGKLTAREASIHGNITAGSTITGATIQNTSGSFKVDNNGNITGANITGSTISIGSDFAVDSNGNITATAGTIGGYTIGEKKLTATNVGMCSDSSVAWAFWAGADVCVNAPFQVRHDGTLYATSANITGNITGSTISGSTISGTNISGGSLEIGGNFWVTNDGILNANKASISGSITASDIIGSTVTGSIVTGSTITNEDGSFEVDPYGNIKGASITKSSGDNWSIDSEGNMEANTLNIEGELSTNILNCNVINNPNYPSTLSGNISLYVSRNYGDDGYTLDEVLASIDESESGGSADVIKKFATLKGVHNVLPKNLNGKTVKIYLESDDNGQILFRDFYSGRILIFLCSNEVKGYIGDYNCYCDFKIYGGNDQSKPTTYGVIRPSTNTVYTSDNSSVFFQKSPACGIYYCDIYGGKSASGYNALKVTEDCMCRIDNCNFYSAYTFVNISSLAQVYCATTSGKATDYAFKVYTGGLLHLANTTQASGTKGNVYTSNGSVIYGTLAQTISGSNGIKWDGTSTPIENNTTTPITSTVTATYKSNYGDTYRTTYTSWKKDGTCRQGNGWGSGDCTGVWFFGTQFSELKGKTITKVTIAITRQSSANGNNTAVEHKLWMHNHSTRPSGAPKLKSGWSKTFDLTRGQTKTITITDSTVLNAISAGTCKGFGIKHTYDSNHYSVCSGSATVKITYEE